jgi:hemerythrin superfamily protein
MDSEELFARIAGKAGRIKATLSGDRGIFRTLKEEHAGLRYLMLQLARTSDREVEVRRRLFERVRTQLLAHTRSEEKELYPILAEHERTRAAVSAAHEEHLEVERQLSALDELGASDPAWLDRFRALMRAFDDHVDGEEDRLFPLAREVIGRTRSREVERRYHHEHGRELRMHGP